MACFLTLRLEIVAIKLLFQKSSKSNLIVSPVVSLFCLIIGDELHNIIHLAIQHTA